MSQQGLLFLQLLTVAIRLLGSGRALILFDTESSDRPTRVLHFLSAPAIDSDCDRASPEVIPIEGYFKLTTAPAPHGTKKLCRTPLVPSGARVDDPRGISFWFMRLRVTRLAAGQKLSIANTDYEDRHSMKVGNDQLIDLTSDSHRYPVVLYLKYRYVRLYWSSSGPARLNNPVNITAAAYAKYKDGLNETVRQDLCKRHGHSWCQPNRQAAGICLAPGGCSQRDDCFDSFNDPERCPVFGNLTGWGSSGAGGLLPSGAWVLDRLRWLALAALPLALVAALARLCAQQRRLDIDENYDYKPGDDGAEEADAADNEADEEADNDERPLSVAASGGGGGGNEAYYSYPSCPPTPPARAATVATLAASATVITSPSTPPPPLPPVRSTPTPSSKASDSVDSETGERDRRSSSSGSGSQPPPPTPPPRSRRRGSRQLPSLDEAREEKETVVNIELGDVCLRRSVRSPAAPAAAAASGDYTEWRSRRASVPSAAASSRCSYTRLLNQPSPDTIEELLERPSAAAESPDRVVYAQLVLPPQSCLPRPSAPPRMKQSAMKTPSLLHFKAPSAPVERSGRERQAQMEMRAVAPRPPPRSRRGELPSVVDPYDLHYIVV